MRDNMNKKKKSKKTLWIVIIIVVVILGAGGCAAANAMKNVSKGLTAMNTAMAGKNEEIYEVKREDIRQEISTSGNTVGLKKDAYTSPVNAKVENICVEVGQVVKKGDVLVTYDATELDKELKKVQLQAKSERAVGNANYEAAKEAASKVSKAKKKMKTIQKDIKKMETSMKKLQDNPNAQVKLEKKNARLADKQAELAKQEAIVEANQDIKVSGSTKTQVNVSNQISDMNVSEARKSVNAAKAGIVAKTDGIVESIEIVKGAYATETQTLMTIIRGDKIGAEFAISKDDLGSVSEKQKARVVIGNDEYEGEVESISRVATTDATMLGANADAGSATGSIRGKVVLTNPDDKIFIGVSAKVYIFVGESKQALAIPYAALCTDMDGDYVYVVNDKNIIERKDVKVGIFSNEYYEILEGLAEGDKVIRNVTKEMKPGNEYVAPVMAAK